MIESTSKAVRWTSLLAYEGRFVTEDGAESTVVKIFLINGFMPVQAKPAVAFLTVTASTTAFLYSYCLTGMISHPIIFGSVYRFLEWPKDCFIPGLQFVVAVGREWQKDRLVPFFSEDVFLPKLFLLHKQKRLTQRYPTFSLASPAFSFRIYLHNVMWPILYFFCQSSYFRIVLEMLISCFFIYYCVTGASICFTDSLLQHAASEEEMNKKYYRQAYW